MSRRNRRMPFGQRRTHRRNELAFEKFADQTLDFWDEQPEYEGQVIYVDFVNQRRFA